jgi:3-deoxy-D-manno-octulosonic-acid transferase
MPVYFFKKKFHKGILARLGFLPEGLALDKPIWVHAVSVGEVVAIKGLIESLRRIYPKEKFVISTVTSTGNKIAKEIAREGDLVTYLPLDFSFIVRSVIGKINPSLFIIAETEIWPNLIRYLYLKNIPIVVVNGRISDRSLKGYQSIRLLLKPVLNKVEVFCVQTKTDANRLMGLGVAESKIKITGNMKFDIKDYQGTKESGPDLRQRLGLGEKEQLLVCGSTHPGEEELILKVYNELKKDSFSLRLLIVPRHPERSTEVAKLIKKFSLEFKMLSSVEDKDTDKQAVFILDSIGQLLKYYAIADIVFVGGSLIKKGGHNILEPAAFAKPILFGPYMFNFRDIAELFLNNKAAILVRNSDELRDNIKLLLSQHLKREELGGNAKKVILDNRGATTRNIECLKSILLGSIRESGVP